MPRDTNGPFEPGNDDKHTLSVDETELLYCYRLMPEDARAATMHLIASMIRRPRRKPNKPRLSIVQ